jgi:hypothetical protein
VHVLKLPRLEEGFCVVRRCLSFAHLHPPLRFRPVLATARAKLRSPGPAGARRSARTANSAAQEEGRTASDLWDVQAIFVSALDGKRPREVRRDLADLDHVLIVLVAARFDADAARDRQRSRDRRRAPLTSLAYRL